MKFETAKETAEKLGVTVRTVQKWASSGKLAGAYKSGRDWLIPNDATLSQEKYGVFLPFASAYCK